MLLRVMQYSFACFLSCVCCLGGAHADGLTFDEVSASFNVLWQQAPTLLAQNAGIIALPTTTLPTTNHMEPIRTISSRHVLTSMLLLE